MRCAYMEIPPGKLPTPLINFSSQPAMVKGISLGAFFLLLMIPSTFALHFNFPQISSAEDGIIKPIGDAYVSKQGIQVTPDERDVSPTEKVGRAIYFERLHLWDKASGNLAEFTTHFTFVIDSRGNVSNYGDGLAFFLAVNSSIPSGAGGGGLGLKNATEYETTEPFVAVEFDTYRNENWDPVLPPNPNNTHVGIDINSVVSVNTATWRTNISGGIENEAWISYNATSKNLTVIFTDFPPTGPRNSSLNCVVDLRDYLPEWVIFGFSASTGLSSEKNNVKSWDFSSSLRLGVNPQEPSPSPNEIPKVDVPGEKKNRTGLMIGLSICLSFLILSLAILSYVLWRRRKQKRNDVVELFLDNEFEEGKGPKKFSYEVLAHATNNFAEGEKLGEGGFGGVYKGFLRDGNTFIAVKKISKGSEQGLKEYASEVKIISRLRHRNLVQLIGWCHQGGELLLVYEFMPNGSLDSHLFRGNTVLNWGIRYKIAQGLASALLYLHEGWEQCVVHRDIKSSNIMLDSSFNAKLGDFGLARLVDHGKGSQTTILAGTMGYMAPECVNIGRSSKETDVYSFGIVALEVACGRRPIILVAKDDRKRTVEWVWELYGSGNLLEAADPKLSTEFDKQEMERLMTVALWCAHPDSNLRPSIRQAMHVLNFEAELPVLPPRMPV